MTTLILAFGLLLLVMAGMAVGLILRGQPIKGSCGGISALGMGAACDICGGDAAKCEKEEGSDNKAVLPENAPPAKLFYDASGG